MLFHPGLLEIGLGGSVLLDLFGERGDKLTNLDLEQTMNGLVAYYKMLEELKWSEGVHSRSVVCQGGLVRRVFEMSLGHGLGCKIVLPEGTSDLDKWLFGELHGAILFATDSTEWKNHLGGHGFMEIGEVTEQSQITVSVGADPLFTEEVSVLREGWARTFKEVAL